MNMSVKWVCALGLLLVVSVGHAADKPSDNVPKEIKQAEQTLTTWLDGFKFKTPDEVRKSLGPPTKESTWQHKEVSDLLLKYKITESTELSLFFANGRVVKAALHLLP